MLPTPHTASFRGSVTVNKGLTACLNSKGRGMVASPLVLPMAHECVIAPFPTMRTPPDILPRHAHSKRQIGRDTAELLTYFKENGLTDENVDKYVACHGGKPSRHEETAFINSMAQKLGNGAVRTTSANRSCTARTSSPHKRQGKRLPLWPGCSANG